MTGITIAPLTSHDVEPSCSLFNQVFGRRTFPDDLQPYADCEGSRRAFVARSVDGTQLLGMCTGEMIDQRLLSEYPPLLTDTVERLVPSGTELMGFLHKIAVGTGYQKQGVGTLLIGALQDCLWGLGAKRMLTVGWTDHDGCHVEGAVRRRGFRELCRIPDFWYQESIDLDYQCASDGQPCRCESRIFILESEVDGGGFFEVPGSGCLSGNTDVAH